MLMIENRIWTDVLISSEMSEQDYDFSGYISSYINLYMWLCISSDVVMPCVIWSVMCYIM